MSGDNLELKPKEKNHFFNSMNRTTMIVGWTVAGHFFSHPFSTAFNRYQISKINVKSFVGLKAIIFNGDVPLTYRGKVESLYRGFNAAGSHKLFSRLFKYTMQPMVANFINKNILETNNLAISQAAAGVTVGVLEVPLLHPIESIKLKRQAGNHTPLFDLIRSEQWMLYKGAPIAACKNALGLGAFFGMSEFFKGKLTGNDPKNVTFQILFLSAMGGAITETLLTNPLDIVKKRMQSSTGKVSAFSVFKESIQHEGARVLYRGSMIKITRAVTKKALPMTLVQLAFSAK